MRTCSLCLYLPSVCTTVAKKHPTPPPVTVVMIQIKVDPACGRWNLVNMGYVALKMDTLRTSETSVICPAHLHGFITRSKIRISTEPPWKTEMKLSHTKKQRDYGRDRVDSCNTRFRCLRFRISAVLFQYYEHQYPTRSQILKPITCVKPSPRLSGNAMQMISLASENSGASLTSKWGLLYVSVLQVFVIRGDSQERSPRV
jgi:hypothetical protein